MDLKNPLQGAGGEPGAIENLKAGDKLDCLRGRVGDRVRNYMVPLMICDERLDPLGGVGERSWTENTKSFLEFLKPYFHVFESLKKIILRFQKILVFPEYRVIVGDRPGKD